MSKVRTSRSYTGNEKFIFISYRHIDIDTVQKIVTAMQDRGYRIWWDEGIKPSEDFAEVIANRLKDCDVEFCFISKNYIQSDFCLDELNYGIKKGKKIVPIKLDDVVLTDGLELRLVRIHMIFMENYDSEEDLVDYLCEECDEILHECHESCHSGSGKELQTNPGTEADPIQNPENDSPNKEDPAKKKIKPKKIRKSFAKKWKKFPKWILLIVFAALIPFVLYLTGIIGGKKPEADLPAGTAAETPSESVPSAAVPEDTLIPTGTVPVIENTAPPAETVIPTISAMDMNRTGNNAKNYLTARLEEDPAVSTGDRALAFLAGGMNDKPVIPADLSAEPTEDLAILAVVLLKNGNIADVRSAQTLLDSIIENRAGEGNGYFENADSKNRNTADNIWLWKAFTMLFDKTGNHVYEEAARKAENFVQSERSADQTYFYVSDHAETGQRSSLLSADTQALAAIIMNDRSGMEKAAGLRCPDGTFAPDDLSFPNGSTRTTALIALAYMELGMEDQFTSALSAISRYQLSGGGIPETGSASFSDGTGRSCSNAPGIASSALYVLAAKGEKLFP